MSDPLAEVERRIEAARNKHWQQHLRDHPYADASSCPKDYGTHDAYAHAATIVREVRAATTETPPADEFDRLVDEAEGHLAEVERIEAAAPDTGDSETGEPVEGIDWSIVTKAEAHQFCRPECCRSGKGETTVEWGLRAEDGTACRSSEHAALAAVRESGWTLGSNRSPVVAALRRERIRTPDRVTDWQEVTG